jgi:hypothetical protein
VRGTVNHTDSLVAVLVCTLGFLVGRRVLGLVGLGPAPDAKDVEIAVLRRQLMLQRRQAPAPRHPDRPDAACYARAADQPRRAQGPLDTTGEPAPFCGELLIPAGSELCSTRDGRAQSKSDPPYHQRLWVSAREASSTINDLTGILLRGTRHCGQDAAL